MEYEDCNKCGIRSWCGDGCFCTFSDEKLFKELERRGFRVTASKFEKLPADQLLGKNKKIDTTKTYDSSRKGKKYRIEIHG